MRCGHSGGYGWWGCKGRRADGRADRPPSLVPEKPLSAQAHRAVLAALDDEYRAYAFYRAVLEKFPYALPFVNIVESEARHAAALVDILNAHGLPTPANPYLGSGEMRDRAPDSLAGACEAAVRDEIDNDRLYAEKLLPEVAGYPAIARIFETLMRTSRECHLPAFRAFANAYRMERPLAQTPDWDCGAACAT